MTKAKLIFKDRYTFDNGDIVEMTIWQVPQPVPPSEHEFKYSLFYGRKGQRIVGYDNERGKGDHKHIRGQEMSIEFSSVDKLVEDFLNDVKEQRDD